VPTAGSTAPVRGAADRLTSAGATGPLTGHRLSGYLLRRLAGAAAVLLLISIGVFALAHLAPGDLSLTLLPPDATVEMRSVIRAEYHLDEPFVVQYWFWLSGALVGDFGVSARTMEPVLDAILSRFGVTLSLAGAAFAITLLTAVPLGVWAALRRGSTVDRAVVGISVFGVSTPAFATGLLLIYVFAVWLDWLPALGLGRNPADRLVHLVLPSVALATSVMALVLKLTRAAMIDVLEQDYVTFAKARGVPPAAVIVTYGLRNALVPVVTASGLVVAYMVTGAVLVEATFSLPGIGGLLVDSVTVSDTPVVQGLALFTSALIVGVNLVTDLVYVVVDPRIQLGRAAA
jgi:peptide/nickel transport system permease protein